MRSQTHQLPLSARQSVPQDKGLTGTLRAYSSPQSMSVWGAGGTGQVFFPQLSRSKASSTSAFLPSNFQQVGQARPCGMEAVHPPLWIPLRARDALCSLDWKGFKARWGHYAVMLCLFPWTPISRLSHGPCGCKALSLPVKLTWRAVSCQLISMNLFNLRELKLVLPVSFGMKI